MAIKVDYVARETAKNLSRNVSITVATILTVFVTFFLLGVGLMFRQGVEQITRRWEGGIQFIIFVNPDATPEQVAAIDTSLHTSPQIEKVTYVDQQAAYDEFKQLFSKEPDLLESVTPEVLPPSYRVVPVSKDPLDIDTLTVEYRSKPGVRDVVSASDTIKLVRDLSDKLSWLFGGAILVLAVSAVALIVNTLRITIYARRREIEVMKLVGATNWFIRIPFVAEGVIQGLVGAGLAIGGLVALRPYLEGWLPSADQFPLFKEFVPAGPEVLGIYLLLAVLGAVIGAVGAFLGVIGFLDA
jgi:cell division transport system permease protein